MLIRLRIVMLSVACDNQALGHDYSSSYSDNDAAIKQLPCLGKTFSTVTLQPLQDNKITAGRVSYMKIQTLLGPFGPGATLQLS